jgi:hypothetical protein
VIERGDQGLEIENEVALLETGRKVIGGSPTNTGMYHLQDLNI